MDNRLFLEKLTKALREGGFDAWDVKIEADGCDGMMINGGLVQEYDTKSW